MNKRVSLKWFLGVFVIIAATLLFLASSKVPSVFAQIESFLSSGEPGYVTSLPAEPQVIGDDPDEIGYTGPIPQAETDGLPSGINEGESVDWNAFFTEPQPDMRTYDQSQGTETQPQLVTDWIFAAGSVLKTRDSSLSWNSDGSGGCTYAVSGDRYEVMNLDLQLPQGSRIDYLRIFYYDTSTTNNSVAWITIYDGAGNYSDLTSVQSSGNAGYGTELSPQLTHIVDNASHTYVLNWRPMELGSNMRLCGLRVAYSILP